jgi:hypothetical protein
MLLKSISPLSNDHLRVAPSNVIWKAGTDFFWKKLKLRTKIKQILIQSSVTEIHVQWPPVELIHDFEEFTKIFFCADRWSIKVVVSMTIMAAITINSSICILRVHLKPPCLSF